MLDPQDELYDRRLATHLVSLYHQTQEEEEEEYLVSFIIIDYESLKVQIMQLVSRKFGCYIEQLVEIPVEIK